MSNRRIVTLTVFLLLLVQAGCIDSITTGVTDGISKGLENVISDVIEEILENAGNTE